MIKLHKIDTIVRSALSKYYVSIVLYTLLLSAVIRYSNLSLIPAPIHPDEAGMGNAALSLLDGSKPILDSDYSITVVGNILTAVFFALFDVNVITLRLQSVLFGIATNLFLFLFVKEIFNRRIALYALIIGCFSHLAIAYSRVNFPNIQAPFFLVSSLYITYKAAKSASLKLIFLAGVFSSLSLYSYTGAKIIVPICFLFLLLLVKKSRLKKIFTFLAGVFVAILPIIFHLTLNKTFIERENSVFIFPKIKDFYEIYNTDSVFVVIYKHLEINFLSFINRGDFSNQYGNGPLLDPLSSVLFILFFLLLVIKLVKQGIKKNIYLLFFILSYILILLFVSMTDAPPLSTRLLILYPIVTIFIALTIESIVELFKRIYILRVGISIFILSIICFLNIKLYFFDYIGNNKEYFNWIEPMSSIALYFQNNNHQNLYLLADSGTHPQNAIIDLLTQDKIIHDLRAFHLEQLIKQDSYSIVIPLVPTDSVLANQEVASHILSILPKLDRKISIQYHYGIPCQMCKETVLFVSIEKN